MGRLLTTRNDEFQMLLSMKTNRQKRTHRGLVFVEGVAPIKRLVASRAAIETIVTTRTPSDWARSVVDGAPDATWIELDDDLMGELSDREASSEIVVVARRPEYTVDAVFAAHPPLVVVMDRTASPGNLGSAIRSCDAFGVDAVIVTGHAADLWDPQTIRSSLGAVFTTTCLFEPSSAHLLEVLADAKARVSDLRIIGTDSGGSIAIDEPDLAPPLVLVFGNEATGLSSTLRTFVDGIASIPMVGSVDSLNLASALSVVLYAITSRAKGTAYAHP